MHRAPSIKFLPPDQLYTTWKENPGHSIVIDPQAIGTMLGNKAEATMLVINKLFECFSDKTILMPTGATSSVEQKTGKTKAAQKSKGKLTILSGVPGSGKTSYAKTLANKNEKTIIVSNDSLRAAVAGISEKDINEKIWNTTTKDHEGKEVIMEHFAAPLMNTTKDAIIATLTSQGYQVIADAVHPKGFMRDGFNTKFSETADIEHVLLVPDTIKNAISHAQSRKERPENKDTIMKVSGWIKEMLKEKKADGTPKYEFDQVVINHYTDGGFEQKSSEEFFESLNTPHQKNLMKRMRYAGYFLDESTQANLREQLATTFESTLSQDGNTSLAALRKEWQKKKHTKFLHHYTIKYQPESFMPIRLGNKKDLQVIGVAYDDKGWALVLQDDECKEIFQPHDDHKGYIKQGVFPHITIATVGNPAYSKTLISRAQRDNKIITFHKPITIPATFGYAPKESSTPLLDHQSLYLHHRNANK